MHESKNTRDRESALQIPFLIVNYSLKLGLRPLQNPRHEDKCRPYHQPHYLYCLIEQYVYAMSWRLKKQSQMKSTTLMKEADLQTLHRWCFSATALHHSFIKFWLSHGHQENCYERTIAWEREWVCERKNGSTFVETLPQLESISVSIYHCIMFYAFVRCFFLEQTLFLFLSDTCIRYTTRLHCSL